MLSEKAIANIHPHQTNNSTQKKKAALHFLLRGTLLYIFFSIIISLFFENTLFWTFLNTVGIAAWTMHKIAMRNRKNLPFRVWLKSIWHGITGTNFNIENRIERDQWQLLQEYELEKYENPFTFDRKAWLSVLVPLIGSIPLQGLYFSGLGEPVEVSLLVTWVISNIFLTLLFAALGSGIMRIFLYFKEKGDREEYKAHKLKTDTRWIDRLFTTIVLLVYISLHVLPAALPVSAAPNCSQKKQDVNTFFECYDSEIKYQPHTEPIVPPIPGYNMPVGQAPAEENYTLAYYETPEPELNLFQAAWKGITGMGKDIAGIAKRDGSKALSYLASNMNNPQKLYTDTRNTIQIMTQARNEGIKERATLKKDSAIGIVDWIGKKFQSYFTNPIQAAKNDIHWMDKNIVQPTINHTNNVSKYIQQNSQESWKATNIVAAPFFHIKVAIESNYPGGTKQLTQDAATILADKETFWNIAKSPFSERTQQLFEEGKYAQATGRANGELSVEGAQTMAENYLTGGGKAGLLVLGFAVDLTKASKRMPDAHDAKQFMNLKDALAKETRKVFANDKRLEHIIKGDTAPGKTGGFHLQEAGNSSTYVIPGTESAENAFGVYEAQVVVNGTVKQANGGKSTFFPKGWTEQDVVNAVNAAHEYALKNNRCNGIECDGLLSNGMKIKVILENNESGKIWSAYPEL